MLGKRGGAGRPFSPLKVARTATGLVLCIVACNCVRM